VENVVIVGLTFVGGGLLLVAVLLGMVVSKRWASSRGPGIEERVGDTEQRLDRLESKHKLLGGEWADYHSKLDSLIRRGVRLGVLERKDGEAGTTAAPAEPLTRSELLKRFREGKGGA